MSPTIYKLDNELVIHFEGKGMLYSLLFLIFK